MDRLLRDAAGQIDLLTYDSTGALADVDTTNAPTIVVLDSAGVATAAFTPSRTSTGTYKATLPANFEVLDTYQATWNFANGQTRRTAFELQYKNGHVKGFAMRRNGSSEVRTKLEIDRDIPGDTVDHVGQERLHRKGGSSR